MVAIQSNYIPWKGYFDLLAQADTVVLFDAVQSTKNDWRNRNQIKTPGGRTWLTVPIHHSNTLRIREVEVASANWHRKHLRTLSQSYARAPHASDMLPLISQWYARAGTQSRLSAVNRVFIGEIARFLGIGARFVEVESVLSDAEHDALMPSERLVELCRRLGATSYLSGPAARDYLQPEQFSRADIDLEWFDYQDYPEYPQLHGQFEHGVSVLDLILMLGSQSRRYAIRESWSPAVSA